MNLTDLKLNRFLYRDNSLLPATDVLSSLFTQTQNDQGSVGGGVSVSAPQVPANALAPGTVVSAVLIQTSGGTYRVELNPKNNALIAYDSHGAQTVYIDPTGIYADKLFVKAELVEDLGVDNLVVNDLFVFKGQIQPVQFYAEANGFAGTFLSAPSGWSIVRNGVGDYTITHNLNTVTYYAFFTSEGFTAIFQMFPSSSTDFTVTAVDDTGAPVDTFFMINVAAFI